MKKATYMSTSKKLDIMGGVCGLLYLAVRAYHPHSASGRGIVIALLAAAVFAALGSILLQVSASELPSAEQTVHVPTSAMRSTASLFSDILSHIGRHIFFLLLIAHYDRWFVVLYRDYSRILRTMQHVFVDIALTELLVLSIARFIPGSLSSVHNSPGGHSFIHSARKFGSVIGSNAERDRILFRDSRRIRSGIFYVCFAYAFFYRFINTTMFAWMIDNKSYLTQSMRLSCSILLLIACIEAALSARHLLWLAEIGILAIGFFHFRDGGQRQIILVLCILIVAATKKNHRALLWIYFIEGLGLLLVSYFAMRAGVLLNLNSLKFFDDENYVIQYALGSISQTDFSAHLLYLLTAWCLLRQKIISETFVLDYPFMLLAVFISNRITHATANTYLILAVIAVAVIHQFTVLMKSREQRFHPRCSGVPEKIARILCFPLCLSFPVFFVISNLLSWFYSEELSARILSLAARVPNIKSYINRLIFAHEGLMTYPVSLFGVPIKESGNGGLLSKPKTYMFLDISYVRVLLIGGILITTLILLSLTCLQIRALKLRQYNCLLLLVIVAVNCLIEHHLYEFHYNIFPILIFTDFLSSGKSPAAQEQ